jgi:type IV secretory pathway VirB10-like protein
MSSRILAGLLVAGCVTAAAGGAYVAVRHNAASDATGSTHAAEPSPRAAAPAPAAVSETEAVISKPAEATPSPARPSAVAPPPAPAQAEPAPQARPTARTPVAAEPARSPARSTATRDENPRSSAPPQRPSPPVAQAPSAPTASAERGAPASSGAPQAAEAAPEQARTPDLPQAPPQPQYEEVVLPAASVIGLQVTTPLSSERTRIEDRVDARVTRDVASAGRVAIPEGSRVIGSVTLVERGGKMKDRARLGVRFHTLVLADGSEVPLRTEPIYREGESPSGESARKIGGAAIGGAILGAIMGGGKGAAIGGATGAAGGSAVVMSGDRNAATLPGGTIVTVKLVAPATIEVQKRESR